jgi:rubrerythrin
MILKNLIGLICPQCGLLFFGKADSDRLDCPACHFECQSAAGTTLHAELSHNQA